MKIYDEEKKEEFEQQRIWVSGDEINKNVLINYWYDKAMEARKKHSSVRNENESMEYLNNPMTNLNNKNSIPIKNENESDSIQFPPIDNLFAINNNIDFDIQMIHNPSLVKISNINNNNNFERFCPFTNTNNNNPDDNNNQNDNNNNPDNNNQMSEHKNNSKNNNNKENKSDNDNIIKSDNNNNNNKNITMENLNNNNKSENNNVQYVLKKFRGDTFKGLLKLPSSEHLVKWEIEFKGKTYCIE